MAPRSLPLAGRAGVRRACAGAFLLALLLAGCGGGPKASQDGTVTLYGTVTRGPTSPVCRPGKPCTAPMSGALVFVASGGAAKQAVVVKDGSYSIRLKPGTYSISVTSQQSIGRGLEPSSVVVGSGPRQKADLHLDTGIR